MSVGKFYTIPDVDFIWEDENIDPIARYKGKEVNSYDLEEYLSNKFNAWFLEEGILNPKPNDFFHFVKSHPDITRQYILKRGKDYGIYS